MRVKEGEKAACVSRDKLIITEGERGGDVRDKLEGWDEHIHTPVTHYCV